MVRASSQIGCIAHLIFEQTAADRAVDSQADEGLRQLRFRLVPKYCSEEQFWHRYFAAVAKVKQQVAAQQAWGDFDMLDEDDEGKEGKPHSGCLLINLWARLEMCICPWTR